MYPPGYSGSYINWAINISDTDLHADTVKNPINKTNTIQFGDTGTSHLHLRIPTHQDVYSHMAWVIKNKPDHNKVYILNDCTPHIYHTISYIMQYDPTGIFVNIHHNNDNLVQSYGNINGIIKWPTYGAAHYVLSSRYNNCAEPNWFESSIEYRNFIVSNYETFYKHNSPIDHDELFRITHRIEDWYNIRNKLQPHEVNESMYVTDYSLKYRVFELSCLDIASDRFPAWLDNFFKVSKASDTYATDYIFDFHPNYVNTQKHLQWFNSFSQWEQTGDLDQYLTSHCAIEAQIIIKIFKKSKVTSIAADVAKNWAEFYNNVRSEHWPMIPGKNEHEYYALPAKIQQELINLGYMLSSDIKADIYCGWETLTTEEINQLYQTTKLKNTSL